MRLFPIVLGLWLAAFACGGDNAPSRSTQGASTTGGSSSAAPVAGGDFGGGGSSATAGPGPTSGAEPADAGTSTGPTIDMPSARDSGMLPEPVTGGASGQAGEPSAGGEDSVNCYGPVLCPAVPAGCPEGQVQAIREGCYAGCVPIESCACRGPEHCPDPDHFTCHLFAGHCGPYLQ